MATLSAAIAMGNYVHGSSVTVSSFYFAMHWHKLRSRSIGRCCFRKFIFVFMSTMQDKIVGKMCGNFLYHSGIVIVVPCTNSCCFFMVLTLSPQRPHPDFLIFSLPKILRPLRRQMRYMFQRTLWNENQRFLFMWSQRHVSLYFDNIDIKLPTCYR